MTSSARGSSAGSPASRNILIQPTVALPSTFLARVSRMALSTLVGFMVSAVARTRASPMGAMRYPHQGQNRIRGEMAL